MISVLVLCYPTYAGALHLDSKKHAVVIAPDEMLLFLNRMGHPVHVANLSPFQTALPLMRSRMQMTDLNSVDPRQYGVCWHMFRDPTPSQVLEMSGDFAGWFPRDRVVNHINDLATFDKRAYLPVLERLGVGPHIYKVTPDSVKWGRSAYGAAVSLCRRFVRTFNRNNYRDEYGSRTVPDEIVAEFLDSSCNGERSFFRVGYAAGRVLPGWLYTADAEQLILKTGASKRQEPHRISDDQHPRIVQAMRELGIDAAHLEGTYIRDVAILFDINPFPTSYGKTLSSISRCMSETLSESWQTL